ncbi:MAG: hypothetical protein WAR79_20565 [Melioribacteraceae bacterium]
MKSSYYYLRHSDFWAGENRKDIFHFDVHNNTDSLFLIDGVEFYQPFPNTGHVVSDFEFTDSTLTNFYQAGDAITSFEPGPIVIYNRNYDSPFQVNSFHGVTYNLEIANIDSSFKVFVYSDNSPKGIFTQFTDGTFELIESTENFKLVSINSKNPKFWFVEDQKNILYKSIDTGKTFNKVDSINFSHNYFTQDYLNRFFIYDPNNLNIYRIINYVNKYQLIVSNNFGELGSWTKTFESSDEIFISYDKSLSGTLYIAVGKQIYISTDYGYSFSLFTEIEQNILGIYKKTNSDLLYVTTKHKLLEINSDSLKTLKQLIDYNNLSYYPLNIGNKWYYEIIDDPVWEIGADKYILTKEVIKDTLLENGKKYFIIQETQSDTNQINLYFERIDSINGKVYRLVEEINNAEEFLIVDLYSAIGDSFQTFINITNFYETENVYLSEEKLQNIFKYDSSSQELTKNYIISTNDNLKFFDYSFAKNFGKTFQHKGHFDAYDEYQNLIAAFINGIKYDDTILVDIKNNKTILLTEFSLT